MKRFLKFIKVTGIIFILLLLFRGILYRHLVKYRKIGKRENIILTNKNLTKLIDDRIEHKILTIDEITRISNEITSKQLSFTFNKVSSNPNKLIEFKKANCIGYSSLFNSIGNYIINKKKLTKKYEFIHLIGKLEFLGYNIHAFFNNPFFKDHDFNEILNKQTNQKIFIDPSLRDYLRIENITSEQ